MVACPAAAWPIPLHRSGEFFGGGRERKVKKTKGRDREAKCFVKAEERAERLD